MGEAPFFDDAALFEGGFSRTCWEMSCTSDIPLESRALRATAVWSTTMSLFTFPLALACALAEVVRCGDERAWLELLMLPKTVLRTALRGGKKNRKKGEVETKELCRAWLEGHRGSLWRPGRRSRVTQRSEFSQEQKDQRVKGLVQESLLAKACATLANRPPAEVTPAIAREMRDKHPPPRDGDSAQMNSLRPIHKAAAAQADREAVSKAVRSFSRGSACGPSGLRPQHVKDAHVPGWRDEVERQLTALVNVLARGEAPTSIQPWLCGATLSAIPKPDDSHRPVAAGETLRRIVGKCLASEAKEELAEVFGATQMGVGRKMGCEAIVHAVRAWLARNSSHPDKCIVTLDLSNAFNAVDRPAVLEAVRRWHPSWAPWADFCYRSQSNLLLGGERIHSSRGVQQGDPLGPALFSLAIHAHVLEAKAEVESLHPGELDVCVFFLDDGVACGTARAVASFCQRVQAKLASIGLELTPAKCEIIPASREHQIPPGLLPGFEWRSDGNFKLLGAAFGSEEFCTAHTLKRKDKATRLIGGLQDLEDTQSALLLLRSCASYCKLAYSARVVPPSLHRSALRGFSIDVRGGLEGLVEVELADRAWLQAQLSILNGGIGLRDADKHAPAAYVSSVWSCQELCKRIDANFVLDNDDVHFAAAMQDLQRGCLDGGQPSPPGGFCQAEAALRLGGWCPEGKVEGRGEGGRSPARSPRVDFLAGRWGLVDGATRGR